MTGDSCLARAVVLCTAAAVDHADTELIGHSCCFGGTGVFVALFIAFYHHFRRKRFVYRIPVLLSIVIKILKNIYKDMHS